MANEKSLANLKPFVPGQKTLNPHGRPKGSLNKKTVLGKILHLKTVAKNPLTGKKEKMTYLEQMFLVQIAKAIKEGDTFAFKTLVERFEGTAVKHTELMQLEMMQTAGGFVDEQPVQTAQGTTIIRRIVFRKIETTSAEQVVNE